MTTKAKLTAIVAGTSNSASATTTSAWIDVSGYDEVAVTGSVTNGAAGPTVAATMYVEMAAADEADPQRVAQGTAGLNANVETPFLFNNLPRGYEKLRVVVTGNTVQPVTAEAFVAAYTK